MTGQRRRIGRVGQNDRARARDPGGLQVRGGDDVAAVGSGDDLLGAAGRRLNGGPVTGLSRGGDQHGVLRPGQDRVKR